MAFWGEEEDCNDYGLTKLHDAAEKGNLEVINALTGGSGTDRSQEVKEVAVKKGIASSETFDDSADDSEDDNDNHNSSNSNTAGSKNQGVDSASSDDDDAEFTVETAHVDIDGRDR